MSVSVNTESKSLRQKSLKYKENEATFKSVTGLAFGTYLYEIIEFDKDGKEIARSGKIQFELKKPHYGGDGRHTVII